MTSSKIRLEFNLHERDQSFPDVKKEYTVYYDRINSESSSSTSLPLLVLLHREHIPLFYKVSIPDNQECWPFFELDFNGSRHYWQPQLDDKAQLGDFDIVIVDAPGFGESTTNGDYWSFDLAAEAVLRILDAELGNSSQRAVLMGDSMGGMHTGGRVGIRDIERAKQGSQRRIAGIVACGTAAEEESTDFVAGYAQDAEDFAKKCLNASPEQVAQHIEDFASGMCEAGYTTHSEFTSASKWGQKIIAASLKQCLSDEHGVLDGKHAGVTMKRNTRILGYRKGLIPQLASRPSPLGDIQVLVVHGTEDNAYPFDRKYHERTVSAIGDQNAELFVVEGGTHFVTATHATQVDKKLVEWIKAHKLDNGNA